MVLLKRLCIHVGVFLVDNTYRAVTSMALRQMSCIIRSYTQWSSDTLMKLNSEEIRKWNFQGDGGS